ncbi:Glycine-rich protein 2 [Morus notabilis]|uniref:Glycine-rich protein 2 n=1 Tax=Morus notabilis TaxID=981085 RepID=W9QND0_9ROSA|nr:Glycine-rich protein 2 [Morus notabilis]
MAESKRYTGTVKWFNEEKGFGFITPDDGDKDIFVNWTSIRSEGCRTLSEGQTVKFAINYGDDGRALYSPNSVLPGLAVAEAKELCNNEGGLLTLRGWFVCLISGLDLFCAML